MSLMTIEALKKAKTIWSLRQKLTRMQYYLQELEQLLVLVSTDDPVRFVVDDDSGEYKDFFGLEPYEKEKHLTNPTVVTEFDSMARDRNEIEVLACAHENTDTAELVRSKDLEAAIAAMVLQSYSGGKDLKRVSLDIRIF